MPDDYKKQVIEFYQKKKANNSLSHNLKNPTSARIKKECIAIYKTKHSLRDNDVLIAFFELDDDIGDLTIFLKKSNPEKFKPVDNFLKDITQDPRERTVELLAWLIDFEIDSLVNTIEVTEEKVKKVEDDIKVPFLPIPISDCHAKEGDKEEHLKETSETSHNNSEMPEAEEVQSVLIQDGIVGDEVELSAGINENEPKDVIDVSEVAKLYVDKKSVEQQKTIKKLNFLQRTGIVATLGLIMGVAYWKGVPPDGCMYWTGTEYKAVDCDVQIKDAQVIALNQQKLDHFKKITLPDTMTFNSLKRVWYSKINNEVEFFTSKGKHPVNGDKILKPVTIYILEKYGNKMLSLTRTNQADTTEND